MISKVFSFCLFLFIIFPSLVHSNAFSIPTRPVYTLEKESLTENPENSIQLVSGFVSVFKKSAENPKVEVDDIDENANHGATSSHSNHDKGNSTNVRPLYYFKKESQKLFILFCSLRIHLV